MNCRNKRAAKGHVCCENCLIQKRIRSSGMTHFKPLMLKRWNGICPICLRKTRKPVLDHDHKTKKFRMLICHSCNIALGLMKENQLTLKRAIKYISGKL